MKKIIIGVVTLCGSCNASAMLEYESFTAISPAVNSALQIPVGYTFRVMIQEGARLNDEKHFLPFNDLNAFVSIDDSRAYLVTSHEQAPGGASVFLLLKDEFGWQIMNSRAVNFKKVRGASTWNNCSGTPTPWGTVLIGEEYPPDADKLAEQKAKSTEANKVLSNNPEDYGWIVEVDPKSGKALRKIEALGRFSHEGATILPDRKTVFMGDDSFGGLIFKFVADRENDLTKGTLFALDKENHRWLEIPKDQLNNAREAGTQRGASTFDRPEDIEFNPVDGKVYIAETGNDKNAGEAKYGRIWQLDPETAEMSVFIQGSPGGIVNPDNIAIVPKTGDLVLHEDRYLQFLAPTPGMPNNSLYVANLKGNIKRFAVMPFGAEVTGGAFAPDGTFFFSLQHPEPPWRSSVIQIIPN